MLVDGDGSIAGKHGSKTKEDVDNDAGCDGLGCDVMEARGNGSFGSDEAFGTVAGGNVITEAQSTSVDKWGSKPNVKCFDGSGKWN